MKNAFLKVKGWFSRHLPTKRRLIQLYSALLFNANLKGYISGDIFKGMSKNACTPGLNCYSCPGAVTACPLGALQNAFSASQKRTPYYIFGILMLYGIMFGRWICGWLCPFGLAQDLLYKIKTPKVKKNRITRVLSYLKYVILVFFVVIVPLAYAFRDFPLPAFCKYICPAGTLGGAVGLLINPKNTGIFSMLGPLFTWKFALLISIIVGSVFIYRMFCRFLCPLGALYGIFNKVALFGIKLEKKSCIDCGKCVSVCKMDISEVGDHECINCGECIPVCPTQAIRWKGSKIILPDSEIEAVKDNEAELEKVNEKRKKRTKIIKIVTASLLALLLVGAIVYFNFIDKPTESEVGAEVGDSCFAYDLETLDGKTLNIEDLRGKTLVINFWGTWCGPCKEELPHFNEAAALYDGEVVIITVHTSQSREEAPDYVEKNYPDSKMVFVYDTEDDLYFYNLGGTSYWPRTVVVDKNGKITYTVDGKLSYEELVAEIEKAILN